MKYFIIFLVCISFSFAKVKIKIKAEDSNGRDYEYLYTLTRKQENRLETRFKKIISGFDQKTRKEIAEVKGYAEEIYGKDNWQMIQLKSFLYIIYDDRFNRIMHKHKDVRAYDVDDF
ncbi:MAG: hypothetical protein COB02_05010 [Candidatus Cloacimonadota bacterium]|nr:MAG: hypothetical protein COB02_05010 [Candidatus Cloacimonadota bacterium]